MYFPSGGAFFASHKDLEFARKLRDHITRELEREERENLKIKVKATVRDKKGRVLSEGENSYTKTHPLQAHYAEKAGRPDAVYLHAEILALIRCKNLKDAYSIHVERYGKQGQPLMAKPCGICMRAIKEAGLSQVTYTEEKAL